MFVEIGDTTPNGRKSNCLADPSGKLNQLEANLLFFSSPPRSFSPFPPPRQQNCWRLLFSARRDSNGMAEITRICFLLCTISRIPA